MTRAGAWLRSGAALVGTAALAYGCWLHYPPLGFIAAGTLLVAIAAVGEVTSAVRGKG